ncbi:MAG: glutamate synthase (NADPH), homotetrameric [Candidatus Anoxymicrobium japonicum]|uniref:Glutamate synthase (NADPH), homotetrameric n=1 Tax=Candidatus Anoxymicrobium japonicum TaxID=2013648 RepID=A0A2N3G4C6_9ACTN|nr:MAG: glutamate synthase (NADPH), homotetrameric [Candidatus Anoxymicrobium japonicum]
MAIDLDRTGMPHQDPLKRIHNFYEVALGYGKELAVKEAMRCLECKNPQCIKGCPVGVDIPQFIAKIKKGDFSGAARQIKMKNALPAICGRVCPQENQCEKECVLAKKGAPVAIGRLERFVADYERNAGVEVPQVAAPTGKRVAVVGSGPGGLTCAGELCRLGHKVTIFEALHKPGGVLVYGIPEFRLPKSIVAKEIELVEKMGAKIELDVVAGRTLTINELLESYDAVYVGSGAGAPNFMGIEGENLNGVYSANEFLTRVNLMKAYEFPEYDTPVRKGRRVAVVGGGNVAMDSARTALRLGAEKVYIVYRRSDEEMPARREEIEHAKEEGIDFRLLTNPTRIFGDDAGNVLAMECVGMELGEPDASGRRSPKIVGGSEFSLDIDMAIIAIGNSPNPLIQHTTPGLESDRKGRIVADENGKTTKAGVFAGGDVVTGAATVISAMGAGKRAAASIHEYIMNK